MNDSRTTFRSRDQGRASTTTTTETDVALGAGTASTDEPAVAQAPSGALDQPVQPENQVRADAADGARPQAKTRLRPPPVPPAALLRSTSSAPSAKRTRTLPPPLKVQATAPSPFEEIFSELEVTRPSAPPALYAPPAPPASRPALGATFTDAPTELAPRSVRATLSYEAAFEPASQTPTRGTPIPARPQAAYSAPAAGFDDVARMESLFSPARPSSRTMADDDVASSRPNGRPLLRFAQVAAILVAVAGGTYWTMYRLPSEAPTPELAVVTPVQHDLVPPTQHEQAATPVAKEPPAAPAPAPRTGASPEPSGSSSGSERHHHRRHHHHRSRSHSRDAADDDSGGSADASKGLSRREQRRLAHEQRVAARHERRQASKDGAADERKGRSASDDSDSTPSRSSARREAASPEPSEPATPERPSSPTRRAAEPAPSAPEPEEKVARSTSSSTSSRALAAVSPSSTSRTATPEPVAPPPPKKPVSMDEMLDRVGPAKPAPAKPVSAADMELDELLRKSLKTGK